MSYDVSIIETTLSGVRWEVFWKNYTSNVSQMWRHAGIDLQDFNGREASEIIQPLTMAIQEMARDPEFYTAMNPENGWGSYEGCLNFLREILDAATIHYKGRLEVDY